MDIDPLEMAEPEGQPAAKSRRLNAAVAISVALLASFMGICKVKDDNIVQAMEQAQADKLDHWAFYQARNLREELAKTTVVYFLSLVPAGFGLVMGLAGLAGWEVHPTALVKLLS